MSAASSRSTGGVLLDRVVLLLAVVVLLGLLRFTEKRDAMDIELIPTKCSSVPVFLCSCVTLFLCYSQCSSVPKSNVRVLLCTRFKGYTIVKHGVSSFFSVMWKIKEGFYHFCGNWKCDVAGL